MAAAASTATTAARASHGVMTRRSIQCESVLDAPPIRPARCRAVRDCRGRRVVRVARAVRHLAGTPERRRVLEAEHRVVRARRKLYAFREPGIERAVLRPRSAAAAAAWRGVHRRRPRAELQLRRAAPPATG